jgi:hypothetical protein
LNKVYVVISYPKDTASIGDRRAGFINLAWSNDEKANKEGLRTKGSRTTYYIRSRRMGSCLLLISKKLVSGPRKLAKTIIALRF